MKITKIKIKNWRGGYVLLETIFYIALFAILSIAVIDALATMTKSFKETTIQAELMQGGDIMERISREIRQASSVNSISINDLKLSSVSSIGVNKTIEFLLSGSDIQLLENGSFVANLNTQNLTVVSLTFAQISTVKGVAVKVFLRVMSKHDTSEREQDFYDTVVLRGSY